MNKDYNFIIQPRGAGKREFELQLAERQLQHDQMVCELMSALTNVNEQRRYSKRLVQSSTVQKALMIAREALEIAIDDLTHAQQVHIRRVSNDYVEYLRNFGKPGFSDPRD